MDVTVQKVSMSHPSNFTLLSMRRSLVEAAKSAAAAAAAQQQPKPGDEAAATAVALPVPKIMSLGDLKPGGKVLGLIQEVAEVRSDPDLYPIRGRPVLEGGQGSGSSLDWQWGRGSLKRGFCCRMAHIALGQSQPA